MTSVNEPIRGKVARVLSAREVALNKGSIDGVEIGMVFKILSPTGSPIQDPDTGELIGSVEMEKTSVKVTSVQERFSVASTFRTYRVNVGGTGLGFSRLFEPPKWETQVESFETDETTEEGLAPEDALVKTGDPVIQDLEVGQLAGSPSETREPESPT